MIDFNRWLKVQAGRYNDKPAIIFDKRQISYRELNQLTAALANRWLKQGFKPGDRIGLAFKNAPEIILINYAAWRAGLVTVPLDTTRDTPALKKYKLKFTGAKICFDPANFKLPSTQTSVSLPPADPKKDALILFTSGTTALPKGVRLSLNNLWANAESIARWLRFTPSDRWQVVLPLHHINSTTFVNTTLISGGTVVLVAKYSKSHFWQMAAESKITGTSIVPTIAYDLLSEQDSFLKFRRQLKSIKRIQIGSAPVQPTVAEEFMKLFKIPLYQGYGQTETALRSTGVPMNLTAGQYQKIRQLNSLGTQLKHTQVTILGDRGRELPSKVVGEICVKGPSVTAGYLKSPTANFEAFKYGWFHSGDTGYWQRLYGRKFFFLKGRTKEIIKKGGVLISPLAVENQLLKKYPALKQVYVVGFPDVRLGEEIGVVAITDHPKVLNQVVSEKHYEAPRSFVVVKEKDLPKTSTGKVQRIKIKEKFAAQLLRRYRTAAETDKLEFRLLGPEETVLLKQALAINNQRWGRELTSQLSEFIKRARFGVLLAAIDKRTQKIMGSVSALRLSQNGLPDTWDEATASGTLENNNHKGDCLVCAAISVKSSQPHEASRKVGRVKLTSAKLKAYLTSNQDSVVRFHRQAKGGYSRGGKLIKVLSRGRPADKAALGYNIIFEYPRITRQPKINPLGSIGVQLIEVALLHAYKQKIKTVLAYSRPADLGLFFRNN